MKILEAHAGILTNFEVLDLLRSRGATSDQLGSLGAVTSSECKVFDYLINSAACNQSPEVIKEFWKRADDFGLAMAEKLIIVNTRPSTTAAIFPGLENFEIRGLEDRLEELTSLVVEILPPSESETEVGDENKACDE